MALVLSVACSDPSYEGLQPDASPRERLCDGGTCTSDRGFPTRDARADATADATVDVSTLGQDAALPAPLPGDELMGTYAMRARYHGRSLFGGFVSTPLSSEYIALAHVTRERGELRLTTVTCRDRGFASTPVGRVNAQTNRPELAAPREYRITLQSGRFRADSTPANVGYEEPPPSDCAPGKKVTKLPEQVWIDGSTCDCPSTDLPPTLPSDCRVRDHDQDMKPGVTFVLSGGTESSDYVRYRESSRLLEGVIAANGVHTAQFEKVEDLYQLGCRDGNCVRGETTFCNPALNPVRFVPLPERTWTCEALMSELEQGRYLPDEPLIFPSGC